MSILLDQLAALFPSVRGIGDPVLAHKVASVWDEAMRTGNAGRGWVPDQLRRIPFTLLAGDTDLRFVEHLNSCAEQCLAIAGVLRGVFGDRVPVDTDTLLAGALLADVGKLMEFEIGSDGEPVQGSQGRLVRHPFTGVALCHQFGLPDEVAHIVATHSHEGDRVQRSIESIIFHHADFIDFDIARRLGVGAAE